MDKTAQKRTFLGNRGLRRNVLQKLHEAVNVPARSAENFFKPKLKELMDQLILKDDNLRSILSGTKIGKSDTPTDKYSLRDLLKEAQSLVNRREYMSAVAILGRFHEKIQEASNVLEGFDLDVSSLHHQFLFNKLPTKHKEQLDRLHQRFAAENIGSLIKESGMMDFFYNIGTGRGRSLAMWEKRYPNLVAPLKEGSISQLENAQSLLQDILPLLKEMASARANRSIDKYITLSKSFITSFKKYDSGKNGFRNFYNTVVRPFMEKQKKIEEQEKATLESGKAVQNMMLDQGKKGLEQENVVQPNVPSLPTPTPAVPSVPSLSPSPFAPTTPAPPSDPDKFKSDQVAEELFGKKSSHSDFIDSLNIFADEPPALLALYISKYAKSIQANNPETAIKLFKLAHSLRG